MKSARCGMNAWFRAFDEAALEAGRLQFTMPCDMPVVADSGLRLLGPVCFKHIRFAGDLGCKRLKWLTTKVLNGGGR